MAGRVLEGRYRLEARLEEGGMGAIWRAQHLVLCAPVAVKLIDPEIADDEASRERFIREAQAAAALRSPHVVQILDYGVDGELPFIVMELLDGENLAQRIRRCGPLTAAETSRILTHVARAVGRAHEAGIVHRDLKPENVFLVRNDDEEIAKVLDFGVAKGNAGRLVPDASRTRTGSLLGTPYYMSPEQAQGNKAVDYRSDLWSLGVIAFECLTGRRPFFSEGLGDLVLQICIRPLPVPSQVAEVPPAFDAWFQRAVARNPEERFSSARELAEALRETLGIEGRETSLPDRGSSPTAPRAPLKPRTPEPASSLGWVEAPTQSRETRGAPNLAMAATERFSPTMRQFGTTSRGDEAPPKRGGTAMLLAVAFGALGAGVAGGLIVLDRQASLPERETTFSAPAPTPKVETPAIVPVQDDEHATRPPAASSARSEPADTDAGPQETAARQDAAAPRASDAGSDRFAPPWGERDASAPSPDAGVYVKPAWARPDDPAQEVEVSEDNPY